MSKHLIKIVYRKFKKIPIIGELIEISYVQTKRIIDTKSLFPEKVIKEKLLHEHDMGKMIHAFEKKLTFDEIQILDNYKKLREQSSPKIAKKFLEDILALSDGGNLSIEIMDAKLPNIIEKLISSNIEKSALFLGDTEDNSKKEIKKYSDNRLDTFQIERAKTFQSRKKIFTPYLATEAFLDIKEVLDKNDIIYFLVSGTLLGAIRSGGFMDNDYDIDLGFFGHQVDIEECKSIVKKSSKFSIVESYGSYSFAIEHTNGILIDLFDHFLENNAICHRSKIHRWYNTPFSLTSIEFSNTTVLVPSNYDLYLSENYGNWKDKVSFYDFSFDTPNVKYSKNIETLDYFTTRITKAINGGWRRTFVCSSRALKQAFGMDFMKNYPTVADGDVMDNLSPRLQMLVVGEKSLDEAYGSLISEVVNLVSGSNIGLDVAIIGDSLSDTKKYKLEEFNFINMVKRYSSCEDIADIDLIKYDKIVLSQDVSTDKFIKYPTINLF